MRWRRLRKWAKWTCTLAAGAAVGLAVGSRFWGLGYVSTANGGDTEFHAQVRYGLMWVIRFDGLGSSPIPDYWNVGLLASNVWYWGYSGEGAPSSTAAEWHAGVWHERAQGRWGAGLSVLYPVALTLIPAALLWYADRRRFGPGSCKKCRYDHRGLAADAKCPECGTIPAMTTK